MRPQYIRHHRTKAVLFEGNFPSLRHAIEQAARDRVCLDSADLSAANLVNASLDEIRLRYAKLSDANLMGANLSEARLDGADFTQAGLQNACLCYSSLQGCRFEGSLFGATDITGCRLDRGFFSTLSALQLNFTGAESMDGCVFADTDGAPCPLSSPPLLLGGLEMPVIVMDRHLRIGGWLTDQAEFMGGALPMDAQTQRFIAAHRSALLPLIELQALRTRPVPARKRA